MEGNTPPNLITVSLEAKILIWVITEPRKHCYPITNENPISEDFAMMKLFLLTTCIATLFISGCGSKSGAEFTLPEGDVAQGKERFIQFGCNACHTTNSVDHLPITGEHDIFLGGPTSRIETYAELVTSVINPSHRISAKHYAKRDPEDGSSPMPTFNDIMSVTDLIHLVTYLQSGYELRIPPRMAYPDYRPWQAR